MNRKTILIMGSIVLGLLLTFFGGLKLGHHDLYQEIVFGNENNKIFVEVDYKGESILIQRYRDTDTISILSPGESLLNRPQSFEGSTGLDQVEGVKKFNWQENKLTLVKINTAQWENIIAEVLKKIIP